MRVVALLWLLVLPTWGAAGEAPEVRDAVQGYLEFIGGPEAEAPEADPMRAMAAGDYGPALSGFRALLRAELPLWAAPKPRRRLAAVLTNAFSCAMHLNRLEEARRAIALARLLAPDHADIRDADAQFSQRGGLPRRFLLLQVEASPGLEHKALLLWAMALEKGVEELVRTALNTHSEAQLEAWLALYESMCAHRPGAVDVSSATASLPGMARLLARCNVEQGVPGLALELQGGPSSAPSGLTAAHVVAGFGDLELLESIGAFDPNARCDLGFTVLHHAVAQDAPMAVLRLLVERGADLWALDGAGRRPVDLVALKRRPEAVAALVALGGPRPAFALALPSGVPLLAWAPPASLPQGDTGGWRPASGSYPTPWTSFEGCEMDVVDLSEMTAERFARDHLHLSRPVLVRGADGAVFRRLRKAWTREALEADPPQDRFPLGAVPYAQSFGLPTEEVSLQEYLRGRDQDYFFVALPPGHPFRKRHFRSPAFLRPGPLNVATLSVEFYAGKEGSGAPVHWHVGAWNLLVYGEKFWTLWPRSEAFFSRQPGPEFFAQYDGARGGLRCRQRPGDILFVPSSWAHATYNGAESVGLAVELSFSREISL